MTLYHDVTVIEKKVMTGERPKIPDGCLDGFSELIQKCWAQDPSQRPSFRDVKAKLSNIKQVVIETLRCNVVDVDERISSTPNAL